MDALQSLGLELGFGRELDAITRQINMVHLANMRPSLSRAAPQMKSAPGSPDNGPGAAKGQDAEASPLSPGGGTSFSTKDDLMSITGAKYLSETARSRIAAAKESIAKATDRVSSAVDQVEGAAARVNDVAQAIEQEAAELTATAAQFTNGAPPESA